MNERIESPVAGSVGSAGPAIEHFEIERSIAKGGMAEVYEATGIATDGAPIRVCIKKILPHLTQDRASTSMFMDEARLASTLHHPNIVQVYDLCVSQEQEYFIVMEYVDGVDVSRLLKRSRASKTPVPIPVTVRIVQEVCRALRYAHEKTDELGRSMRIIHRDISPQNILVSKAGDVKLTDFGIAKSSIVMTTTAVGLLKGKYGYMSPEQARGEPLDHRSDLFNVGIILYELLVGRRCFKGANDFETLELMRNATVTPPRQLEPGLSVELEQVVMTALARHPRDRYQTADALERAIVLCPGVHPCSADELGAYLERSKSTSQSPSADLPPESALSLSSLVKGGQGGSATTMPASSRVTRRRPVRSVGATLTGLAVGALAGVLSRPGSPSPAPVATPSEALVVLDSTPEGATVFLDGIELAHRTPVVVKRPRGDTPIRVRVTRGDLAVDGELVIGPRRVIERHYVLEDLGRSTARVHVASLPRADVYIDGVHAGRTDQWIDVPAGRPIQLSVRADSGEALDLRLELAPREDREVFVDLSDVWL